jgi:hypothetical protein
LHNHVILHTQCSKGVHAAGWGQEGRENRESGISLTQMQIENNDSGVPEQVLGSQFNIAQNSAQKAGAESLTRMHRHCGDSPVLMPEKNVTTTRANNLESNSSQDSNELLALQPGKASHTDICWMPTSSSESTSPRSFSKHNSIASRMRFMRVSRVFACVWQPRREGTVATK